MRSSVFSALSLRVRTVSALPFTFCIKRWIKPPLSSPPESPFMAPTISISSEETSPVFLVLTSCRVLVAMEADCFWIVAP